MRKETEAQTEVRFGIEVLWRALAKDLWLILPKVVPNLVRDVQLLEGDGGLGTLMLINFGSDVANIAFQKEQIVEFNEMEHRIGLKVIEGGHLSHGYASYKTVFQLSTKIGVTDQTQVDFTVIYDTETEEIDMPLQTAKSALAFINCLEIYLLKNNVYKKIYNHFSFVLQGLSVQLSHVVTLLFTSFFQSTKPFDQNTKNEANALKAKLAIMRVSNSKDPAVKMVDHGHIFFIGARTVHGDDPMP